MRLEYFLEFFNFDNKTFGKPLLWPPFKVQSSIRLQLSPLLSMFLIIDGSPDWIIVPIEVKTTCSKSLVVHRFSKFESLLLIIVLPRKSIFVKESFRK